MTFLDIFHQLHQRLSDIIFIGLIDKDGIFVESHQFSSQLQQDDIQAFMIELINIYSQMEHIQINSQQDPIKEFCIRNGQHTTFIQALNQHYFLTLMMPNTGNEGKARYLMRVSTTDLLENL